MDFLKHRYIRSRSATAQRKMGFPNPSTFTKGQQLHKIRKGGILSNALNNKSSSEFLSRAYTFISCLNSRLFFFFALRVHVFPPFFSSVIQAFFSIFCCIEIGNSCPTSRLFSFLLVYPYYFFFAQIPGCFALRVHE